MTKDLAVRAMLTLGLLLVGGEAVSRWALGLGTPPLSIGHPTIDYMFRPNQNVRRFGNWQQYNEYGMRSGSLPSQGSRKIALVMGDSVVNGGSLTDQKDLATTIATQADAGRFYANISAGGWGPNNHLAYLREYGLFEADTAIFVYSSHDMRKASVFRSLNPATHPTSTPVSALAEGVMRYLSRQLASSLGRLLGSTAAERPGSGPTKLTTADDVREMLEMLRHAGMGVCFVLHPTQTELANGFEPGKVEFLGLAANAEIPVVDLAPLYLAAATGTASLYRDDIHINAAGQKVLTDALGDCAERARVPRTCGPRHRGPCADESSLRRPVPARRIAAR